MKFIKQLLCKHIYGVPKNYMYDSGMSKFSVRTCDKCGREKVNSL